MKSDVPMKYRYLAALAAGLLAIALVAACGKGGDSGAPKPVDPTCSGKAPYATRGPWSAGVLTLTRGSTVVEVWYPSARAAAQLEPRAQYDARDWMPPGIRGRIAASARTTYTMDAVRDAPLGGDGALPVVLFSHGLAAFRSQSSFLTAHLASWGFVVVAPDHPERGLARILSSLSPVFSRARTTLGASLEIVKADRRFSTRLDLGKVGALGHSAGGITVSEIATDGMIRAWVSMSAGGFRGVPAKPVMLLTGDHDGLVEATTVLDAYDALPPPGRGLRILRGLGHLAFSDICLIGRENGGLVQIAADSGLELSSFLLTLARDGCQPGDLPPERAWPAIDHFVTATFRSGLGVDPGPVGLDAAADGCFGSLISQSKQDR